MEKNSPAAAAPSFSVQRDYHDFAKGYHAGDRQRPAHLAWALEKEAVQQGWTVGRYIGSESELIVRFGANRDTVREAIRLLEARGSIVIERGRRGGSRLAEPHLDWAAGAMAMFLRARDFTDAQLHETLSVVQGSPGDVSNDSLIAQLLRRTCDLLTTDSTVDSRGQVRGFQIATRLIQHYSPIPAEGIRLGSESVLCERFRTSRPTFRQALRILDDLGTLQVQRGRGGGYILKRPSCIGVVRQMFALLASRQQTLEDVLPMKWMFDIVKLRLAMRTLRQFDGETREEYLQNLSSILSQPLEPNRWCLLQQGLGRIAKNPLVNTLLWCLVAYDVRVAQPSPSWSKIETELSNTEHAVVRAIREGSEAEAESQMRRAQDLITGILRETGNARAQHPPQSGVT